MDVLRQVFSVLLVFSLLGAVLWLLRRGGRISFRGFTVPGVAMTRVQGDTRSMVAVERLALTPQHMLHRVRINGREVLVATHPQGCSVVPTVAEQAMGAKA
jgi:Flagellar biosynthesis protein, FliO